MARAITMALLITAIPLIIMVGRGFIIEMDGANIAAGIMIVVATITGTMIAGTMAAAAGKASGSVRERAFPFRF